MPFFSVNNLTKIFKTSSGDFYALKNINLSFSNTGFVAITGKSGCGKTTLLNTFLNIEKPTSGNVLYKGKRIDKYSAKKICEYRNSEIGVIFQHYNLFNDLSVIDNIIMPSLISGISRNEAIKKAKQYLSDFSLDYISQRKVINLSGGEKQRVAIIRSLMNSGSILLCDEPTGALDEKNSVAIMELLQTISKDKLVIIVSHNKKLVKKYCSRIITLEDGMVIDDTDPKIEIKTISKKDIKSRISYKWTSTFTYKHLRKNITKNLLTFVSTAFGLIAIMLAIGFNNGIEETSKQAIENNLALSVAQVSKKEYVDIANSPLQYEKSLRPNNDEISFLYAKVPSLVVEPNISYFIPSSPTFRFNGEVINGITFVPIYSNDTILEFDNIIINDKAANLLNSDDLIDELIKLSFSVSPSINTNMIDSPIVKDNIDINLSLSIKKVVDEFSFLNTPKIYYSYPLFIEYLESITLENISEYKGERITALDYVISANNDSIVSSFSQTLFVTDIKDVEKLFSLKEELDERKSPIRIDSDVYSIRETYVTFMTSFSSSFEIFILISFIGVCFIIGITSLSSFISNKKESAILTILGAKNKDVTKIFVNESLMVVFLSIFVSFVLSFPFQKIINKFVFSKVGIPNIISIPFSSFLGYPYALPILVFLITTSISLIFILTPLLIYKRISLSNELKDE